MNLNIDDKYNLIISNLQEILLDESIIKKIMQSRPLKVYWGTACTSSPSIAYIIPMLKIKNLVDAGCEVTILLADLHAILDNLKSTFEQVQYRAKYYRILLLELLKSLDINISNIKFVLGSDFQLSKEYTLDMYKAHSLITVNQATHAGAEVVKQSDNPKMTGLMYPTLQALDEQYLGVDLQLSGIDQRKIVVHAINLMPKLGYKKRGYLMTSMITGLRFAKKEEKKDNTQLDKMSSSDKDTKIDLLDTKNQLKAKINKVYCLTGDIDDNTLLILLEKIIFPVLQIKKLDFVINRPEKYGGVIRFSNINEVNDNFKNEKLFPGDLKLGIIDNLDLILDPIRKAFDNNEMKQLVKLAYPN